MAKRTHKLGQLGNVADIIAKAPSVTEAARRLGVSRQAVYDWISSGKAPKPAGRRKRASAKGPAAGQTPAAWARGLRRRYDVSGAEDQVLQMLVAAFEMAGDTGLKAADRLTAMKTADRLLGRLEIEVDDDEAETPKIYPRRA